jgi:hypothetical protein
MPRLVHTHDTIDTLDGPTGPHNPTQYCIHTRIGRLPLRAQTLTHHLLQERQLGEAGAMGVRGIRHGIIEGPQADECRASAWLRHGLSQLLMPPVKRVQGPLITPQAPDFAPLRPGKQPHGGVQLPLDSRTVVARSLRPKQRQSGPDLLGGGFGLDRLSEEPLGLPPRTPRLSGHAARIVSILFRMLYFGFGLGGGVSDALSLPPLVMQNALELVLGMQDVKTHRARFRGSFLVCLIRRFARLLG